MRDYVVLKWRTSGERANIIMNNDPNEIILKNIIYSRILIIHISLDKYVNVRIFN